MNLGTGRRGVGAGHQTVRQVGEGGVVRGSWLSTDEASRRVFQGAGVEVSGLAADLHGGRLASLRAPARRVLWANRHRANSTTREAQVKKAYLPMKATESGMMTASAPAT